jgi:hypothetical protein
MKAKVMPSGALCRPSPGTALADSAGTAMVIVVVWAVVPGTNVAGENVAVAPAGNPVALSVTALPNGLVASSDATWIV